MTELANHRKKAQESILEAFAHTTGRPIGLFEGANGDLTTIFPSGSLSRFEQHCKYLHSLPGGKEECNRDHCGRAGNAMQLGKECLTVCHAGLYNQAVPIKVKGEMRAALLYGQMRIDDPDHIRRSLENHNKLVDSLNLTKEQADTLHSLLSETKSYSFKQLDGLNAMWPNLGRLIYFLFEEEDRLKRSMEKVNHEIQTRLQAVIADAENLVLEVSDLSPDKMRLSAQRVLDGALALDTVIQTLGEYLEEYNFEKRPIAHLVREARRVYRVEAIRHGIDIRVRFIGAPPLIEVSQRHIQLAINNLLHNAVKYSFRGGHGRGRVVWIIGQQDGNFYRLVIENYGVGILKEEIDKETIFEDGYQGKLTQGEYRTGSGKGLFFVKNIIERHYGRIEVESRLVADEDTPDGKPHLNRFAVYLPYQQPDRNESHDQNDNLD